jgi:hypothetical protein
MIAVRSLMTTTTTDDTSTDDTDTASLTVPQLRKLATAKGVKATSKMRKADLIKAIQG